MSPVSRGRKGKKKNKPPRQFAVVSPIDAPDECDCPACSGEGLDPQALLDDMTGAGGDLLAIVDPLEAELLGAALMSAAASAGGPFEEGLVDGLFPEFEARATAEASALLLTIGSVAGGEVGKAALAAVDRLVDAGVPRPAWAAELSAPTTVGDCHRLSDPAGTGSMLACAFHRAGRSHAIMISVDHLDCGAASEIVLFDADQLPEALRLIRAGASDGRGETVDEVLDAAEFRWQLENALNARAAHDAEDRELGLGELPDDEEGDGPPYEVLAELLRARMGALPLSNKPPAEHEDVGNRPAALTMVGGRATAKLPAKRTKAAGEAPVYQIKVGLRGAKPPIWRRIEVSADTDLRQLHQIVQVAFGWDDSHLHAFRTPYGEFGIADPELDLLPEERVTLEQVAPEARSAISYVYDFGDDWEHQLVVEKVLDRDEHASYPRCTGGRRAAPPEDSGGIWGYTDLLEILAEPAHPEYEDRLEWLGLDKGSDFDPASFDAAAINQALARVR